MNRTVKHCIVYKHAYIHIIHKYKSLQQQLQYQYQCQYQQRQTVTRTMDKTIREKSSSEQKHSAHNTRVSSRTKILFARNAMIFFGIFNTNLFTWRVMYWNWASINDAICHRGYDTLFHTMQKCNWEQEESIKIS